MTRTELRIAAWLFLGLALALVALSLEPSEVILATTGGPCPG
jgi:hypothetical protein